MAQPGQLPCGDKAEDRHDGEIEVDDEGEEGAAESLDFAELLGPHCVVKRVDKDKNVVGGSNPADMQHELVSRAQTQKRLGACAEHVKDMGRDEKLKWAVGLKDKANEFYFACNFEEAAKLYNDCLVALDLDGSDAEIQEVKESLQLPVCTNLAACMIEMGLYARVVEICDVALSVDSRCAKALYRRGLARYRLANHSAARPDFESALSIARERIGVLVECEADEAELHPFRDIERRTTVYLIHIRRFATNEKTECKRMFAEPKDKALYEDRPAPPPMQAGDVEGVPIDDSDAALDEAIARARGDWSFCCCPRRTRRASVEDDGAAGKED